MKNKFKKISKLISTYGIGFIAGALIFGSVGAETVFLLSANNVTYDNTNTGMSATNVQSALETIDNRISELEEEANPSYAIGQEVTLLNEKYNVIGSGDDYVTLLKQDALTVTEINTYGAGHVNMYNTDSSAPIYQTASDYNDTNHTGGMAYYSSPTCGPFDEEYMVLREGCTTDYASSEVKYAVDAWAQEKFQNDELKTVDGYGARLATKEELQPIGWPSCSSDATSCSKETDTPSWIYNSNYTYWTMSPDNKYSSNVWAAKTTGAFVSTLVYSSGGSNGGAVRPVINVYKSKI